MEHIRASNLLRITKDYLSGIVLPAAKLLAHEYPSRTHTYRIHTQTLRIVFFSEVLERRFTKALAHLEVEIEEADLTVIAWDGKTIAIPSPLVSETYHLPPAVDAQGITHDEFLGAYIHGEESVTLFDLKTKTAYYYVSDAEALPHWVDAAPLRTLLHWFLGLNGLQLMHGAVVGYNGAGVLLTAPGGSGKSTTAFNCVQQGMEYLGDDYVAINEKKPITAYSLYSSAKLTQDAMEHLPPLTHTAVIESGMEKAVLHVHETFPEQMIRESKLLAIFVPKIYDGETTYLLEAGKAEVLRAVVPTTLFQLPLARKEVLSVIREIVEELPCYFLMLGKNRNEAPKVIMSFIKDTLQ